MKQLIFTPKLDELDHVDDNDMELSIMGERNQINRGNSNTFGLEDEAAKSDNSTIKDETPLVKGTLDDVTSKS
jgi:hypothetical protein